MALVEIKKYIGTDSVEIQEKKHNIWIPISLSNKVFTPEHIEALIRFALENTKEKVLVLIPGRMHATNYRYFDGMRRSEAIKKGYEDEDACREIVEEVLQSLPEQQQHVIKIANYDDVCTPKHMRQKEVFFRAFAEQGNFYEAVIEVMKDFIAHRGRTFEVGKAESLALYALSELPFFVDGVNVIGDEATFYTLNPYPGSGKLDDLEVQIIEGNVFPELTKQLKLQNKVGIIDVDFI